VDSTPLSRACDFRATSRTSGSGLSLFFTYKNVRPTLSNLYARIVILLTSEMHERSSNMIIVSPVRAGAGYKAKQKATSARLQPCSTSGLPRIFHPLVISRMIRAELEIEQLIRKRALNK
jgi:hypothetical protein